MKKVVIHPQTKEMILRLYLIIYPERDEVAIKQHRLSRAARSTIKSQTNHWPLLRKLLLACKEQIVNGKRFNKVTVKNLAEKTPAQIVSAVTRSLI